MAGRCRPAGRSGGDDLDRDRELHVGVELGQLMALALILTAMTQWRARPAFARQAYAANVLMMVAGFALMGLQITGYLVA